MLALEVPEEELVKRLLGRGAVSGRADDQNETVIRNRIREYETKTAPLKEFYSAQRKFKAINGVGDLSDITARLVAAIG
jgi:adenylate kinase